ASDGSVAAGADHWGLFRPRAGARARLRWGGEGAPSRRPRRGPAGVGGRGLPRRRRHRPAAGGRCPGRRGDGRLGRLRRPPRPCPRQCRHLRRHRRPGGACPCRPLGLRDQCDGHAEHRPPGARGHGRPGARRGWLARPCRGRGLGRRLRRRPRRAGLLRQQIGGAALGRGARCQRAAPRHPPPRGLPRLHPHADDRPQRLPHALPHGAGGGGATDPGRHRRRPHPHRLPAAALPGGAAGGQPPARPPRLPVQSLPGEGI
ncbi:MAG: Oxidoreductase, short-chain dehydrogenase/reductase family, partial [uncultured Craurococcus sp.]